MQTFVQSMALRKLEGEGCMRYYAIYVISNGLDMPWASICSDTIGLKGKLLHL